MFLWSRRLLPIKYEALGLRAVYFKIYLEEYHIDCTVLSRKNDRRSGKVLSETEKVTAGEYENLGSG